MNFEEQNDLLQDYRYRKHILEEISLTKIKEWNNADWNNIINKPTTLDGYGITDVYDKTTINYQTLNTIEYNNGGFKVKDGFNLVYDADGSSHRALELYKDSNSKYALKFAISDTDYLKMEQTGTQFYAQQELDFNSSLDIEFKANRIMYFNSPEMCFDCDGVRMLEVDKYSLTSLKPFEFKDIKIIDTDGFTRGGLWSSTYNINGAIKDGLHLTHEASKYAVLGYYNTDSKVYNSYMIMDYYGVLKTGSEGNEWAPIRFEQDIYSRHNIRMGSMSDIIIGGVSLLGRLSNCEKVIADGTGIVDWVNVKNKPNYLNGYGNTINGKLNFVSVDGYGLNFWESEMYSIYMSSANNTTCGGRLWEIDSDYNMYFKMTGGTNRGFVFKNDNTVLGGLDGNGVLRAMNAISTKNIYFGGTDATATGSIEDGNITLNKTKIIYSTNTNGEKKNLIQLNAANVLCVGNNGGGTTLIVPNASADALVWDCSEAKNYKIWNEKNFNPNNYMPWNYNNIKTGSAVTNFRGLITGNSGVGGFLQSFRKDDSSDGCMPIYGSGVAWGQGDTHGFIYTDYSTARAYVGGGSNNRLLWTKEIAFKDEVFIDNSVCCMWVSAQQQGDSGADRYYTFAYNSLDLLRQGSFANNTDYYVPATGLYEVSGLVTITNIGSYRGFTKLFVRVPDKNRTHAVGYIYVSSQEENTIVYSFTTRIYVEQGCKLIIFTGEANTTYTQIGNFLIRRIS